MGPYAEFGIIEAFDKKNMYHKYEPEKYHCIKIPDDAINR
ncbi:hypothetical protein A5880_000824 [Enterococcus sp. 4G2_DIV0659]|uniref:Uncharacterized protein n=1 Tax=Candidatus Enterococcus mansonii TaxID=1834181 RepID=A0A242C6X2_9ENTE|nr:hypothetical protein A5880_003101 [Enterococcus sp. 4G2_DIV0659]